MVHRALFDKNAAKAGALKAIAEHISVTERNSADAERDSKDVKLYAFLIAQLESGEPIKYPALVTDVRNFGFFVDVPGLAMSGLVPLSLIEDDFYVFDEARRNLVGRRTRRVIKLGDKLTVQVGARGQIQEAGGFPTGRRGGQSGCATAATLSASSETPEIIAARFKTSLVVAARKNAPAGSTVGQVTKRAPVRGASAKCQQAGHVSNLWFQVFHHATSADQIQRFKPFLQTPPVKYSPSPPEQFPGLVEAQRDDGLRVWAALK